MKTYYNDATPFLVTEFGWNTPGVGLTLQATNLRDTYNWFAAQTDIITGYWYQWNDGDGGWGAGVQHRQPQTVVLRVRRPVRDPRPAGCGFQRLAGDRHGPLTVQFTDLSTGYDRHQSLTFGDDTSSSQTNHRTHTRTPASTVSVLR